MKRVRCLFCLEDEEDLSLEFMRVEVLPLLLLLELLRLLLLLFDGRWVIEFPMEEEDAVLRLLGEMLLFPMLEGLLQESMGDD